MKITILHKIINYYNIAYRKKHFPSILDVLFSKRKIVAYYGFLGDGNLGDELVYEAIKKMCPSIILFPIKKHTPILLRIYKNIFYNRFSGVIIGGGTQSTFNKPEFHILLELCKNDKPLFVHGTGVYIKKYQSNQWAEILKNKNYYGGVRGPLSKDKINIPVIGDAAISLFKCEYKHVYKKKKIIINFGTHHYYEQSKQSRRMILNFICNLIIKENYDIYFLPFHSIDEKIGEKISKENPTIKLLDIPKNSENVFKIFEDAVFAIGERLHFNIVSLMCRCPFVSINYDEKHEDFLSSVDMNEVGVKMEDLTISKLAKIFHHRDELFDWEKIEKEMEQFKNIQIKNKNKFLSRLRFIPAVHLISEE
jgi:polysaccharide pyruvyl transferase WcaK-like protein